MNCIGQQKASVNDVVTYYIEQDSNFSKIVTLLFLKDINLSAAMATFYENSSVAIKVSSEKAIESFVDYLVSSGIAKLIQPNYVKLGDAKRPSKLMQDEYKYRQNPSEFLLVNLQKELDKGDILLENGIEILPKGTSVVKVKATIDIESIVDVIEFNIPHNGHDDSGLKDSLEEYLNGYFGTRFARPEIRTFNKITQVS